MPFKKIYYSVPTITHCESSPITQVNVNQNTIYYISSYLSAFFMKAFNLLRWGVPHRVLQMPHNTLSLFLIYLKYSEVFKVVFFFKWQSLNLGNYIEVNVFLQAQQQQLTLINRRCFVTRVYPVAEIITSTLWAVFVQKWAGSRNTTKQLSYKLFQQ